MTRDLPSTSYDAPPTDDPTGSSWDALPAGEPDGEVTDPGGPPRRITNRQEPDAPDPPDPPLEVAVALPGVTDITLPPSQYGSPPLDSAEPGGGEAALLSEESPLLAGRYRLLQEIGRGGMGTVYLAEHAFLGKRFALKILPETFTRHPELMRSFLREARAASQLIHENIVSVTDFGETGFGSLFYVMEYLDGEDLAHRLRHTHAFHHERARRIALQICRALAHVHAVGLIHRDLKPENVFLLEKENTTDFVKLLDFGIARHRIRDAAELDGGALTGTPEYMAPERITREAIDHRVDIYATGCILYEMLTGYVPFQGSDPLIIFALQLSETPPTPAERARHLSIPDELGEIVMKAIAKHPSERFQSATEMAETLAACGSARRPSFWTVRSSAPPAEGAHDGPASPLDLLARAIDALDGGQRDEALRMTEELVASVGGVEARDLVPVASLVERIYTGVCGSLDKVIEVIDPSVALDARTAFLLSRIDGRTTIGDVVIMSGMRRLEAIRLLALFIHGGSIVAWDQRPPIGPSDAHGRPLTGRAGRFPTGQAGRSPTGQAARLPTGQAARSPTGQAARSPTGQQGRSPTGSGFGRKP